MMLKIVGGTYIEFCNEPHWLQLYGSGTRAAAALSKMATAVELNTYICDKHEPTLQSISDTFKFQLNTQKIPHTIQFSYFHGLSRPEIEPPPHVLTKAPPQLIQGDIILRFGFLEGDAVVCGEWVVYDPQDAYNARPFSENGSTAKHLAIVANYHEASHLAGENDIGKIGKFLISEHNAEVVVIKRGSFGATVITESESKIIPAYKTKLVWPIGSGDIFAAVFTYFWGEKIFDPFTAAGYASRATAYYCNNKSLPIPVDEILAEPFKFEPIQVKADKVSLKKYQAYLAGPFFTMSQRWMIEQARTALRNQGLSVFSPLHDVGHGLASQVVPKDIAGLNKSNVVFAIADGLDAGTLFEIGYAQAKGIPIIVFVQNETEGDLKMLEGSNCEIIDDFTSAVYRTVWTAMSL